MTYRNKRTGIVVEVSGIVHGDDWEEVSAASSDSQQEKPAKKRTRKAEKTE